MNPRPGNRPLKRGAHITIFKTMEGPHGVDMLMISVYDMEGPHGVDILMISVYDMEGPHV